MKEYYGQKFEGKKFHCKGEMEKKYYDEWGREEYKKVGIFELSWQYKKYLYQKKKKELEWEIEICMNKIKYELKTYGDYDKTYDGELDYLIKKYNELY